MLFWMPIIVGNGALRVSIRIEGRQAMKKQCHLNEVYLKIKSLKANITLEIQHFLSETNISYRSWNICEIIVIRSIKSNV
jgi:hypothetical protein